jgi:hypothetical protein
MKSYGIVNKMQSPAGIQGGFRLEEDSKAPTRFLNGPNYLLISQTVFNKLKFMIKVFSLILFAASVCFASESADSSPKSFFTSCFKDYINGWSTSAANEHAKQLAIRERCLSKEFNAKWNKLVSADELDADAFLLSQDLLETWKSDISVKSLNKKSSEAVIILGSGKQEQCLTATYIKQNGSLKIASISKCSGK